MLRGARGSALFLMGRRVFGKFLQDRWLAWEKEQHIHEWEPIELEISRSAGGATLTRQDDGSILASGENPENDTYTLIAVVETSGITGVELEALPHESFPAKGPGRAASGNFGVSDFRVTAAPASDPSKAKKLEVQSASASYSDPNNMVSRAIDDDPNTSWAIEPRYGESHRAVFELKEDLSHEGGTILTFTVRQAYGPQYNLGRFRMYLTRSQRPVRATTLPENIVALLRIPRENRNGEQTSELYRYWVDTDGEVKRRLRLTAAQDVAWALINSPAFLFNR